MRLAAFTIILLALILAGTASPALKAPGQSCLDATAHASLDTHAIVAGLGLGYELELAVRARLSTYNSVRGFAGLDGLGLTTTQVDELQQRIAAQTAATGHPLGWPCAPFKNQTRVIQYVKAKLAGGGFTSAVVVSRSARQFQFTVIGDGTKYYGVVARSAARTITVRLDRPGWARTYIYRLAFDA